MSGNGALSTQFSGAIGGKALLLRSILTDSYEGLSFSGHYGEDAAGGKVQFGSADEDTFTAKAHLGADTISLRCPPGGTTKAGWPVTGTVGGQSFSARMGGPATTVHGDTVKFFFGSLASTSFDVTGEFSADNALPGTFGVTMKQGSASVASSLVMKRWESPWFGAVTGTLSGPPTLLIAALGWWTAFLNQQLEGFSI